MCSRSSWLRGAHTSSPAACRPVSSSCPLTATPAAPASPQPLTTPVTSVLAGRGSGPQEEDLPSRGLLPTVATHSPPGPSTSEPSRPASGRGPPAPHAPLALEGIPGNPRCRRVPAHLPACPPPPPPNQALPGTPHAPVSRAHVAQSRPQGRARSTVATPQGHVCRALALQTAPSASLPCLPRPRLAPEAQLRALISSPGLSRLLNGRREPAGWPRPLFTCPCVHLPLQPVCPWLPFRLPVPTGPRLGLDGPGHLQLYLFKVWRDLEFGCDHTEGCRPGRGAWPQVLSGRAGAEQGAERGGGLTEVLSSGLGGTRRQPRLCWFVSSSECGATRGEARGDPARAAAWGPRSALRTPGPHPMPPEDGLPPARRPSRWDGRAHGRHKGPQPSRLQQQKCPVSPRPRSECGQVAPSEAVTESLFGSVPRVWRFQGFSEAPRLVDAPPTSASVLTWPDPRGSPTPVSPFYKKTVFWMRATPMTSPGLVTSARILSPNQVPS